MKNKKELLEKLALRESVRRKLEEIEFNPNRRIKLPKETLNDLLFNKTKNGIFPGYFGAGLCKLDLSEISFEGVLLWATDTVDFSNTNIKIDFRKVARSPYQEERILLDHIDFTNVDLSDSHLKDTDKFDASHCSFKNTNLSLTTAEYYQLNKCDLTGLDLSSTTLYSMAWKYDPHGSIEETLENYGEKYLLSLDNCNLSNTGATIKVGPNDPMSPYVIKNFCEEKSRRQIGRLMAKGYLKNCIIEDETIKPIYSKKELLEMEKNKTSVKSNEMIEDTLSKIDEQIKSFENESATDMKESTGSGSFYGCDNVPEVKKTTKGKKLKNTINPGSFYGCGNVPGEE